MIDILDASPEERIGKTDVSVEERTIAATRLYPTTSTLPDDLS
jgi:hypothetical protein